LAANEGNSSLLSTARGGRHYNWRHRHHARSSDRHVGRRTGSSCRPGVGLRLRGEISTVSTPSSSFAKHATTMFFPHFIGDARNSRTYLQRPSTFLSFKAGRSAIRQGCRPRPVPVVLHAPNP